MSSEAILFTDPEDIHIMWAAMLSMVEDNHAAQDNLTLAQWDRAKEILAELQLSVEFTYREKQEKER